MARIVLHIGPEKCGSTSIQQALAANGAGVPFLLLDPFLVVGLDADVPDPNVVKTIATQIETRLAEAQGKVLVVSHEMIFKSRRMLEAMAEICARSAEEVRAVAFVRRQSDFAVSGFGQWHFRSRDRLREARQVLEAHGVDPVFFSGVERHLMAGLLDDWQIFRQPSGHMYLNWRESVATADAALLGNGIDLSVGVLPRAGFRTDLIADFMVRAGVEAQRPLAASGPRNRGFSPALIEATVNAVEHGYDMPGPHEANGFFAGAQDLFEERAPASGFLDELKARLDTAFWPENEVFAKDHTHPPAYFAPDQDVPDQDVQQSIAAELSERQKSGRASYVQGAQARAERVFAAWRVYADGGQS